VPRYLRFEIDERLLSDGSVLRELSRSEVAALVRALAARGIRAIAVSLLHAYQNPVDECQVGEIIAEVAPGLQTSLSSEVVPEIKEYERTSTTAFGGPASRAAMKHTDATRCCGRFHVARSPAPAATHQRGGITCAPRWGGARSPWIRRQANT
jgi:N-methylhydantoinase A/oxoprolinase/acetone carboxylase beta subunit